MKKFTSARTRINRKETATIDSAKTLTVESSVRLVVLIIIHYRKMNNGKFLSLSLVPAKVQNSVMLPEKFPTVYAETILNLLSPTATQ